MDWRIACGVLGCEESAGAKEMWDRWRGIKMGSVVESCALMLSMTRVRFAKGMGEKVSKRGYVVVGYRNYER
jgi:hypothetical protein